MIYQRRLPFPRGQRYPTTCGHPDKPYGGWGMCSACYHREYRKTNPDKIREIKARYEARKKARTPE